MLVKLQFKNNKKDLIGFSPVIISTSLPRAILSKYSTAEMLWVCWEGASLPYGLLDCCFCIHSAQRAEDGKLSYSQSCVPIEENQMTRSVLDMGQGI